VKLKPAAAFQILDVRSACEQTGLPLNALRRQYGVQKLRRECPGGRREDALLVPSELLAVASVSGRGI